MCISVILSTTIFQQILYWCNFSTIIFSLRDMPSLNQRLHFNKPESYSLAGEEVPLSRNVCSNLFDSQVQQKVSCYHIDVWGKAKANSCNSFILCIFTSLCSSITSWTDIKGSIRNAKVCQTFPHSSLNFISALERCCSSKKPTVQHNAVFAQPTDTSCGIYTFRGIKNAWHRHRVVIETIPRTIKVI